MKNQLAFPSESLQEVEIEKGELEIQRLVSTGMTLRQYYAAHAMQALITSKFSDDDEMIAKESFYYADRMLEAEK